jgi:hypothetical protein
MRNPFYSRIAATGTGLYLLGFVCASIYAMSDRHTFTGIFAVFFAVPWIDFFPKMPLLLGVAANATVIYLFLAAVSNVPNVFRHSRE